MFYDVVETYYLGNRDHVLKHLHERIIFGPFEKCFHEGNLWRGYRALISLIIKKQIFLYFHNHGDQFHNIYINKIDKKKSLDDDGTGVKTEHFLQKGMRYSPSYNPIQKIWDRYHKIAREKLGIKKNQLGEFIFLGQNIVRLKSI